MSFDCFEPVGTCSVLALLSICRIVFFVKQKTAYEMRISDWSSDVCSSDLGRCARPCQQSCAATLQLRGKARFIALFQTAQIKPKRIVRNTANYGSGQLAQPAFQLLQRPSRATAPGMPQDQAMTG